MRCMAAISSADNFQNNKLQFIGLDLGHLATLALDLSIVLDSYTFFCGSSTSCSLSEG